jgi:hypothetical protein
MSLRLLYQALATATASVNPDTLLLNAMSSSDFDFTSPYSSTAGIRLLTTGVAQAIVFDSWTQTGIDEWIDGFTSGDSTAYECKLDYVSGTAPTMGNLAAWETISATKTWSWSSTTFGTTNFSGTLYIREIANTSNIVSCSVTITLTNSPP